MTVSTVSRQIKVMIVDDSAVIRSIIEKTLRSDPSIKVCGFASTGEQAVQTINICDPDIILLDIEMPVMDGITAIPLLLAKKPHVKIIMCSTLSERGATISIKAMSLGAVECIAKPTGSAELRASEFNDTLLRMIRSIGTSVITKKIFPTSTYTTTSRHLIALPPKIVAIGSSTGGPNALEVVLKGLKNLPVPIVITQHMPKTFTKILATHLSHTTGIECREGEAGMLLEPGKGYVAPGGFHMLFKRVPEGVAVELTDDPPENFCKPAVDPMFRSLASLYEGRIVSAILTGMGEDGLQGARKVVATGGSLVAQNQETSIVWGMPGAVANAGICGAILPLSDIAGWISKHFK